MSFLTSLFSCCLGRESNDEKTAAEARHARIMDVYTASSSEADETIAAPPPSYADIAHDRPYVPVVVDEKSPPSVPVPQGQQSHQEIQYPPEVRRASMSSRSSVVSVPSTRLSDLTSMYAGTTRRNHDGEGDGDAVSERNGSWRSAGWYGSDQSAPPSYYAGSERSVTPTPPTAAALALNQPVAFGMQHPVMQEGWLEGLRTDAERERILRRYRAQDGTTG